MISRSSFLLFILIFALILSGCATSSVQREGPNIADVLFDGFQFGMTPGDPTSSLERVVGEVLLVGLGIGPEGAALKVGLGLQGKLGGIGISEAAFVKIETTGKVSLDKSSEVGVISFGMSQPIVVHDSASQQHSFSFEQL